MNSLFFFFHVVLYIENVSSLSYWDDFLFVSPSPFSFVKIFLCSPRWSNVWCYSVSSLPSLFTSSAGITGMCHHTGVKWHFQILSCLSSSYGKTCGLTRTPDRRWKVSFGALLIVVPRGPVSRSSSMLMCLALLPHVLDFPSWLGSQGNLKALYPSAPLQSCCL